MGGGKTGRAEARREPGQSVVTACCSGVNLSKGRAETALHGARGSVKGLLSGHARVFPLKMRMMWAALSRGPRAK